MPAGYQGHRLWRKLAEVEVHQFISGPTSRQLGLGKEDKNEETNCHGVLCNIYAVILR
jgi:hypothetical protein